MSDETLYEHPETGELVPYDQIDWSNYEVDTVEEIPEQRSGFADGLTSSLESAGSDVYNFLGRIGAESAGGFLDGFSKAWGGGEQLIAENHPRLADFLGADAGHGNRIADAGTRLREDYTGNFPIDTSTNAGKLTELLAQGAGSAGKFVPAFAASYLFPPSAPFVFGGQIGAETIGTAYDELRERGIDPESAQDASLARAGVDAAAGALIPGGTQAKSLLGSMGKTALTLQLFNTISEATRSGTEQGIVEDGPIDLERLLQETGKNVLESTPQTLATAPFFSLASRASQRRPSAPEPVVEAAPEVKPELPIAPEVVDTSGKFLRAGENQGLAAPEPIPEKPVVPIEIKPNDLKLSDAPPVAKPEVKTIPEGEQSFPESPVAKPEQPEVIPYKLEQPSKAPTHLFEIDPETGLTKQKPSIYNIGDRVKDFTRSVFYAPDDLSTLKTELKESGLDPEIVKYEHVASNLERLFNGQISVPGVFGPREIPGVKNMAGAVRKQFILPWKMAKRDPKVMKIWRLHKDRVHFESETAFDLYQKAAPFFDMVDSRGVGKLAYEIREKSTQAFNEGKILQVTPETLRAQGVPEPDIQAYFSLRDALTQSWKMTSDAVVEAIANKPGLTPEERQAKVAKVRQFFLEKEQTNYVPIERFGDYYVYAKNPTTGREWYSFHDTATEMRQTVKNLGAQGYGTAKEQIKTGKVRKTQDAFYDNLPVEMRFELSKLIDDPAYKPDLPLDGFRSHFLRAKLTPGYEADLRRNAAKYITSMSYFLGKTKYDSKIKNSLNNIDPKSPVYQETADWIKYMDSNPEEFKALRAGMAYYYLTTPSTTGLNLTQSLTTTYPELRRYTKTPGAALAKAIELRRFYNANPERFKTKHPELFQALELAKIRGETNPQILSDLMGIGKGKQIDMTKKSLTFSEWIMSGLSWSEKVNREVAYIAALQAAPKSANFAKKVQFAEDFVTNTQFDYTKMGRPKIARGWKAPLYTFRLFGHNYYSILSDAFKEVSDAKAAHKKHKTAGTKERLDTARGVRNRYGASIGALGGASALPFVSLAMNLLAANGVDVKALLRESIDNDTIENLLLYGPLSILPGGAGVQLTGAISPGEQLNMDKGIIPAAEKLVFGTLSDLYRRPFRAWEAYEQTGDWKEAVEEAIPRGLRTLSQGVDAGVTGKHRSIYGDVLVDDVTPIEAAYKAAGFNPSRFGLAGEKYASGKMIEKEATSEREGMVSKYANAYIDLLEGNKERGLARLDELDAYSRKIGYKPQMARIKTAIKKKLNPKLRAVSKLPKAGRYRAELEGVLSNFEEEEEEDE